MRKSGRDYFHADIDKKCRDCGCHKSENSTVTDKKSRELDSQENKRKLQMDAKEIAKKYIHHRNLLVRGQLELSVIMSLINTGMLLGLFLKTVLNIPTNYVVYIILGCVTLTALLQYLFGWYYEQKKLFDEENNWMTDRTPVFQKLIDQKAKR